MRNLSVAERAIQQIESAAVLDRPAEMLSRLLRKVIPPGPIEDLLSGIPSGHPAHPVLVTVPIGAWCTASMLDVTGADGAAAQRVEAVGILTALPASLTGANDWLSTTGPERRVGLVHALSNYGGLALHLLSWRARRRGRRVRGAALALAGTTLVGVGGWMGGHLAHALGVGVDTTAFQQLPAEWTDVCAETDVPAEGLTGADADGVPVLLTRSGDAIVAYADRCTHRGGPLHEGELRDGCVVCPWHGSAFDLSDGAVVSGPAVRPQPRAEVDVREGRVRIRRKENRTLRTNPVGH